MTHTTTDMPTDTASYVYLAARDVPDDVVTGLTGVAGSPLRLVRNAGLTAVVSSVDLAEFGEDGLRRNLEDLAWLERVARAHDQVVHQVGRVTAVAPWRLATIMLDDDRVAELLGSWETELKASLDRVEGCSEWSVKMLTSVAEPAAGPPEPTTGTAYLQQRRAANARQAERAQNASVEADQLHVALSQLTMASRRLPPQDRRLTGHKGDMVLNGAYLVRDDESEKFAALVEQFRYELGDTGRLELNGPWPPYSFATLEPSGPA